MTDNTVTRAEKKDTDTIIATNLIFKLWEEWCEELKKETDEEEEEVFRLFCQVHGVKEKSPLSMMFKSFMGGVSKGIELTLQITDE